MIVLGMLSVLLLMGVAFSVTMRTERAGASNMRHAAMARHILDTAIVRTMSDLDKVLAEQGDLPVPTGVVVAVSTSSTGGEGSVNPLCYEASLHLPADQLIAAAYSKAQWLPIYGDVRITANDDKDPAYGDSPVGRYSYVILNNSGLLDPNVIGASNRLFGLSPCEVDIEDDNNRVLGLKGADNAERFLETRDDMGHFATMRDFLSASNDRYAITNLLGLLVKDVEKKRFSTNCFFVGSLAIDDLAPPTGVQTVGSQKYPIRKPKFSLRERLSNGTLAMIDPADIISDNDLCNDFLEAMENSFAATYESWTKNQTQDNHGRLPEDFTHPHNQNKSFSYPLLAARNLLEMMDDDGRPGGTAKHSFSKIGDPNGNEDEYLKKFGVDKWNWDCLPCVEPVPLLDSLVVIGGILKEDQTEGSSEDQNGDETLGAFSPLTYTPHKKKIENEDGSTTDGEVTNITFTINLSIVSAPIYPGLNVPAGADGDYTYRWRIFFPGPNVGYVYTFDDQNAGIDAKYHPFLDGLRGALSSSYEDLDFEFKLEIDHSPNAMEGAPAAWRMVGNSGKIKKNISFSINVNSGVLDIDADNLDEFVPEEFCLVIDAVGIMGRGNKDQFVDDIVQVVPCQDGPLGTSITIGPSHPTPSSLEIPLVIKRSNALRNDQKGVEDAIPVLGAAYAVDSRFAFKWNSWLWLPAMTEQSEIDGNPLAALGESLRDKTLDDITILRDELNPLSQKFLTNPYEKFAGEILFEIMGGNMMEGVFGVGDEMRATPDSATISASLAEQSARTVFFDPSAPDTSPWAFTRVGQLGWVPIGTFRTIALMDGFDNVESTPHVEVRQRVLDYFTMNPPQDDGSGGGPVKSAKFTSRIGLNPPTFPEVDKKNNVVAGDANLLPLTAAFNGCPLREWQGKEKNGAWEVEDAVKVDWDIAQELAAIVTNTLGRTDADVGNVDGISGGWDDDWDDADGVTRSLSVLGRSIYDSDASKCVSIESLLRDKYNWATSIDREGVIRNTAEMLTTRQQLFTILLKADSFTPKFGFSDAEHGTSLASVQAVAHVWRDPEPLRDADGKVILDGPNGTTGNPIHAWVLLDLYQF